MLDHYHSHIDLIGLLEDKVTAADPESIRKAKHFFKACVNTGNLEKMEDCHFNNTIYF